MGKKTKPKLEWNLESSVSKDQSVEEVRSMAIKTIETRYRTHLKIYTDGNKVDGSTTAAMWVPSMEIEVSWKLDHGHIRSIMGAELYAISRVLHWLVLNQPLLSNTKVVILSDSKSGILAIHDTKLRSCSYLTNQIRR